MTNQFSQKNDNETLGTNAILKVVAIFLIIVLAIQFLIVKWETIASIFK